LKDSVAGLKVSNIFALRVAHERVSALHRERRVKSVSASCEAAKAQTESSIASIALRIFLSSRPAARGDAMPKVTSFFPSW
jgi:hypothetical protein